MRILHLYRPRLPGTRAQALQVVHTCHALSARGHHVTLFADRAAGYIGDGADVLSELGLGRLTDLDLRLAPTAWLPGAGLWFRASVKAWCARGGGVVYARAKRYVDLVPARIPVVIEAHELDSALDREAGRDAAATLGLEEAVFERASGIVTNCAGTLSVIRERWGTIASVAKGRTIWNATRADRVRVGVGGGGVGVVGSAKEYKGVEAVSKAAGLPVVLVGAGGALDGVDARPAVPYGEVPRVLAAFDVLLLPLAPNLFGRSLTNPLKLWDYLATDRPLVLPDLPTIREVLATVSGEGIELYDATDLATVAPALVRARAHGPRRSHLRTWDERAAEIEAYLLEILG